MRFLTHIAILCTTGVTLASSSVVSTDHSELVMEIQLDNNRKYVGRTINAIPNGPGTMTYGASGGKYVGEFVNGVREGHGTFQGPGRYYSGHWRNDMKYGLGTLRNTEKNGKVNEYIGSFSMDLKSGSGRQRFADGRYYDGEWKANVISGRGTMTYPDGSVYAGEFRDGQMNGEGVLTKSLGDIYVGHFLNGQRSGFGTQSLPDGSLYEGEWSKDIIKGQGKYTYRDGSEYMGQLSNGVPQGNGIERASDGSVYDGEWDQGRKHGNGYLTTVDGNVFIGKFSSGRRPMKAASEKVIQEYHSKKQAKIRQQNEWKLQDDMLQCYKNNDFDKLFGLLEVPENSLLFVTRYRKQASHALYEATARGGTPVVRRLIEAGLDKDEDLSYGITPLWIAADKGHLDLVRYLISLGPNLNCQDQMHATPLLVAVTKGYSEIANELIVAGTNVSIAGLGCKSPLVAATLPGNHHVEMLQLINVILQRGADQFDICMGIALSQVISPSFKDAFVLLINAIADKSNTRRDKSALLRKSLLSAAHTDNSEFVNIILNTGEVSINDVDSHGESLLSVAARSGLVHLVDLALSLGALPNLGYPLHAAAIRGNPEIVDRLLLAGADVDALDDNGRSVLVRACDQMRETESMLGVVWRLLRAGARIGAEEALRLSAQRGHSRIVSELLRSPNGIHPDDRNREGQTALILAVREGHIEIVRLLISASVDLDIQDSRGLSALGWSLIKNHQNIWELLLSNGASPDIKIIEKHILQPIRESLYQRPEKETLEVIRDTAFDDSLQFLTGPPTRMFQGPGYVRFVGEDGMDMGGLRSDWFSAVSNDMFSDRLALFKRNSDGEFIGFNPAEPLNEQTENRLKAIGRFIATALLMNTQVPIPLPSLFYARLLNPDGPLTLKQLERDLPDRATSLQFLLNVKLNTAEPEAIGDFETPELDNSPETHITTANAHEIVYEILNSYFPEPKMSLIRQGFNDLIPISNLRNNHVSPTVLRAMVFGVETVDPELIIETMEGPGVNSNLFNWLKQWLRSANQEYLRYFLRFVTGNPQVPRNGFTDPKNIKVGVWTSPNPNDTLPRSHTCTSKIDLSANVSTQDEFNASMNGAVRTEEFGIA